MTAVEQTVADLWATGVSPDSHPTQLLRAQLDGLGAVRIDRLGALSRQRPGQPPRVLVGGMVTHRQRPATAGGVTFLNLEDETGMLNVICSRGCGRATARWRWAARPCWCGAAGASEGVINLVADRLQKLALAVPVKSARLQVNARMGPVTATVMDGKALWPRSSWT